MLGKFKALVAVILRARPSYPKPEPAIKGAPPNPAKDIRAKSKLKEAKVQTKRGNIVLKRGKTLHLRKQK